MKALLPVLQPLAVIWLLHGAWLLRRAVLLHRAKRTRWTLLRVPILAWLLLTSIACTPLSSLLISYREDRFLPTRLEDLPPADAIVCLGGGVEPSAVEPFGLHLKSAADRLPSALAAYCSQKAPLLVFGGGGYSRDGCTFSEADEILRQLVALGFPAGSLLSLGVCADTHDEAVKVADLAGQRGWAKVIVVTSAVHMPRTMATFRRAGLDPVPLPCNYLNVHRRVAKRSWFHWPNADGFIIFGAWSHEWIGEIVYRWRGWI